MDERGRQPRPSEWPLGRETIVAAVIDRTLRERLKTAVVSKELIDTRYLAELSEVLASCIAQILPDPLAPLPQVLHSELKEFADCQKLVRALERHSRMRGYIDEALAKRFGRIIDSLTTKDLRLAERALRAELQPLVAAKKYNSDQFKRLQTALRLVTERLQSSP